MTMMTTTTMTTTMTMMLMMLMMLMMMMMMMTTGNHQGLHPELMSHPKILTTKAPNKEKNIDGPWSTLSK